MTVTTHLCLVSGQPTPNLTPALDRRIKPKRIILLVSPTMKRQAAWLAEVLERQSIKVEQWPVDHAYDVEHLQTRVLELLEKEKDNIRQKSIALNATGGTKPMSIAAYESFRAYDLPIFYVHPERDRVVWLHHPDGRPPAADIEDRIRIEPFLQAHGVSVQSKPSRNVPNPELLKAGEQIINELEQFYKPLGTLNFLAHRASGSLRAEIDRHQFGQAKRLITLFSELGFLQYERGQIRFPNEDARFFVNGGWLEYLVFDAVRKLRKKDSQIQDIARSMNVERERNGKRIPNELDVVFLRNNRLYLIECKTSRLRGKGEDSPGAEALYKLDVLGDLMGGLKSKGMVVSYQDVGDHVRNRAADMRIAICAGRELRQLGEFIEQML